MNIQSLIIVFVSLVSTVGCSDSEPRVVKEQAGDAVANNSVTLRQEPIKKAAGHFEEDLQKSLSQPDGGEAASPEQLDQEIKDIVDKITSLPGNDLPPQQLEAELKSVIKQLEASNAQAD